MVIPGSVPDHSFHGMPCPKKEFRSNQNVTAVCGGLLSPGKLSKCVIVFIFFMVNACNNKDLTARPSAL